MTDLQALGLFSSLLLASVAVGEGLRLRGWRPESSRRAVHVGVGLTVAASPAWFAGPGPIYALAAAFLAGNALALGRGWPRGMHGIGRRSLGTVVFPLALIVALALCWTLDPGRVFALQAAFAVLALADPAASWVGTRVASPGPLDVAGATKSVAGSAAFVATAFVACAVALGIAGPHAWPPGWVLGGALVAAVLAGIAEALGRGGWDNLWIVVAVVVPLAALDGGGNAGVQVAALAVAVGFGVATYLLRALDLSGALAGTALAWMLVALGGVAWAAPALAFFVLSSAASRLGRHRKSAAQSLDQKGSRRDVGQVLANGGVAAVALTATVFVEAPWLFSAFVGAFAAAAADTWGTEVGTLVGGPTRRLGLGAEVPAGTSGGVSLAGTVGGVVGAVTVVGAAALAGGLSGAVGVALVGVAVAASALDSLLGATVQARYRADSGALAESPQHDRQSVARGVRWVDNDAVNWACTVAGGVGGALVWVALA